MWNSHCWCSIIFMLWWMICVPGLYKLSAILTLQKILELCQWTQQKALSLPNMAEHIPVQWPGQTLGEEGIFSSTTCHDLASTYHGIEMGLITMGFPVFRFLCFSLVDDTWKKHVCYFLSGEVNSYTYTK